MCCIHTCMKLTFCGMQNFSNPAAGLLLRSRLRGTQGPPVLHGASVGPGRAPWRVLWKSKYSRDCFPTSESQPGPCNPQKRLFILFSSPLPLFSKNNSSRQRLGMPRCNSRASLCDSHERCLRVWVREQCVCACHCRILQQQ